MTPTPNDSYGPTFCGFAHKEGILETLQEWSWMRRLTACDRARSVREANMGLPQLLPHSHRASELSVCVGVSVCVCTALRCARESASATSSAPSSRSCCYLRRGRRTKAQTNEQTNELLNDIHEARDSICRCPEHRVECSHSGHLQY